MAQEIELPDGSIAEFPDGMAQADIESVLKKQFAPKQEGGDGFLDRVSDDLSKRWDEGTDAANAYNRGEQTLPEYLLQIAGKTVAGSINDVVGEGVNSAFQTLPDNVQNVVKDAAGYVSDSAVGDVARQYGRSYQDFAKENPNAARSIESVGNIAALVPISRSAGVVTEAGGDVLRGTGQSMIDSAATRVANKKAAYVKDLVMPRETPTVRADQFGRATEEGLLRNRVVQPTSAEQAMIDSVGELPVSNSQSLLANYNVIADANRAEADALISRIRENDVQVSDDALIGRLSQMRNDLEKNPYVVGDGAKAAESVLNGALEMISAQPRTASGLLQARKDFDAWISSQRGQGAFDPARETAVTSAIRGVRQTLNDVVAESVPSAEVRASLARQSNFYRAMENLQEKGAFEAPNLVSRAAQKIANGIPGKTMATKALLSSAGIGAGVVAPLPVAGGLAAYGTVKALTSPTAQKVVGGLLSKSGKALGGKVKTGRGLLSR